MPSTGPRRTDRPIDIDRDRFADGVGALLDRADLSGVGESDETPDFMVDVIRGADLLAIRVGAFGLEVIGGDKPVMRAGDEGGHLVVNFTFQHMAEQAIYEEQVIPGVADDTGVDPDPPGTSFEPPISARPAKWSRLVFVVPPNVEIPFSSEGVLDAMSQLPMSVHPLARPRTPAAKWDLAEPIIAVNPGMVGMATVEGLVIGPETDDLRGPDPSTAAGSNRLARDRRMARSIAARLGVVAASGTDPGIGLAGFNVVTGGHIAHIPDGVSAAGINIVDLDLEFVYLPQLSRAPKRLETSIEAPYRLMISPSELGRWAHSNVPVVGLPVDDPPEAERRVELWHTRLGVSSADPDDTVTIDEVSPQQRVIRAIWTRDREAMDWKNARRPEHDDAPFPSSLDGADRHMLVRQSSESWLDEDGNLIIPDAVSVRGLYLSSVGAWLDLHGAWDTDPYTDFPKIPGQSNRSMSAIESWDHVAPMGRDQFVKVVYPGYLWPFGHRASLVKLTERKMRDASPSIAGLYQRKFLVIKEPIKRFNQLDLPFTEVRIAPLVTPTLSPDPGNDQNSAFVPNVGGSPFVFILHCRDHEDREVHLATPLTWVSATYDDEVDIRARHKPHEVIVVHGQKLAFARVGANIEAPASASTLAPTSAITFDAKRALGTSVPKMVDADITIDAVEHLSGVGPVKISYHEAFTNSGFGGPANAGMVWAKLHNAITLEFGSGNRSGSDKAGGFIQPNLKVAGLSLLNGAINDLDDVAAGTFDPVEFLSGVVPRLFGLVDLAELLDANEVSLKDDAPVVVSGTLNRIEGFEADLERAERLGDRAVAEATRINNRTGDNRALIEAVDFSGRIDSAANSVRAALEGLDDASEGEAEAVLVGPVADLRGALAQASVVGPLLPPLIRRQIGTLTGILQGIADAPDLASDAARYSHGMETSNRFIYRYEWTPKLKPWPDPPDTVLDLQQRSLVLAIEGRMNGKGEMGVEALAELKDFSLILLPETELVQFDFDHLSFRASSAEKSEVDVVLDKIEFLGILGFVDLLSRLIPFDGFSDPPYLDVTDSGLVAGFSQDIPNIAIGVFSLSNLSLGADIQVPFFGEMVTVGFNFCTRERPFALAVAFIGGGGFFVLRLSPDGLTLLELSLEAGAVLAVEFGVASGSISAMLGIYMRLEGKGGSLAGYFQLRGSVDVLGLISASIELYLALGYDFETGKMVGSASLTIKVEILFFSISVTIEAERQFAGSNGDPNFIDVMGLDDDGSSPAWSEYCHAFAGA